MRSLLVLLAALVLVPSLAHAEGGRVVQNPAKGSPEEVVAQLLELGAADKFDTFYKTLCHPDYCLNVPHDEKDKQKYMWPRFLKYAGSYYKNPGTGSFEITSTQPATVDGSTTEVKIFLRSSKRDNPVPVVLKKDAKGDWKVFNNSL